MICSSLYRLFFMPSPPVQFTRELQFSLVEFFGGTSGQFRFTGGVRGSGGNVERRLPWQHSFGFVQRKPCLSIDSTLIGYPTVCGLSSMAREINRCAEASRSRSQLG